MRNKYTRKKQAIIGSYVFTVTCKENKAFFKLFSLYEKKPALIFGIFPYMNDFQFDINSFNTSRREQLPNNNSISIYAILTTKINLKRLFPTIRIIRPTNASLKKPYTRGVLQLENKLFDFCFKKVHHERLQFSIREKTKHGNAATRNRMRLSPKSCVKHILKKTSILH